MPAAAARVPRSSLTSRGGLPNLTVLFIIYTVRLTKQETLQRRIKARLKQQRTLVDSLLTLRQQLQGSLITRYGQCGKQNCVCRRGQRHGPYYVLSTRSGGSGGFTYLERTDAEQARQMVRRFRAFRTGLKRLQRFNQELVELLRRYQLGSAREGGRQLGIPIEG